MYGTARHLIGRDDEGSEAKGANFAVDVAASVCEQPRGHEFEPHIPQSFCRSQPRHGCSTAAASTPGKPARAWGAAWSTSFFLSLQPARGEGALARATLLVGTRLNVRD